jgi:hypothetical protein
MSKDNSIGLALHAQAQKIQGNIIFVPVPEPEI